MTAGRTRDSRLSKVTEKGDCPALYRTSKNWNLRILECQRFKTCALLHVGLDNGL